MNLHAMWCGWKLAVTVHSIPCQSLCVDGPTGSMTESPSTSMPSLTGEFTGSLSGCISQMYERWQLNHDRFRLTSEITKLRHEEMHGSTKVWTGSQRGPVPTTRARVSQMNPCHAHPFQVGEASHCPVPGRTVDGAQADDVSVRQPRHQTAVQHLLVSKHTEQRCTAAACHWWVVFVPSATPDGE